MPTEGVNVYFVVKEADVWKVVKVSSGGRGIYVAAKHGSKREATRTARSKCKSKAGENEIAAMLVKAADGSVSKYLVYAGDENEIRQDVSIKKESSTSSLRPYRRTVRLKLNDFNRVHSQLTVTVGHYITNAAAEDAVTAIRESRI